MYKSDQHKVNFDRAKKKKTFDNFQEKSKNRRYLK